MTEAEREEPDWFRAAIDAHHQRRATNLSRLLRPTTSPEPDDTDTDPKDAA